MGAGTGLSSDGYPRGFLPLRVTGRQIVAALKGHWAHGRGSCCCPAHDDRDPSLSVRDLPSGQVLVHDFGGCSQERVIEALRAHGLWPERDGLGFQAYRKPPLNAIEASHEIDADELANLREARAIWNRALPLSRPSLGWLYLWSRHVMPSHAPPALRWLPELYNTETKKTMPALVAAVQDRTGRVTAIQRTWVTDRLEIVDGSTPAKGTRAALNIPKKSLGHIGDGAVRLGRANVETLGIAEGIETSLAAKQIYSLPVWASLGAWRMGSLWLPEIVRRVVIFADAGDAGVKAASKAAQAYSARGIEVIIEFPPEPHADFAEWASVRAALNQTTKSAA